MAKRKRPKKSGGGISIWKGLGVLAKLFDDSTEWMAKHTGPKPAKARRASVEWTSKAQGNGEHLPVRPRDAVWTHQSARDKEIWRATFMDGYSTTFVTWPPRDHVEAVALAKEYVVSQFGVYAQTWEVASVERVGLAVEDELTEDVKA